MSPGRPGVASAPSGILITGSRSPVALEWARRLGRVGNPVVAADSFRFPACRYSRYVGRHYNVPAPRWEGEAFVRKIAGISGDAGIRLILPTCEEIFHLARYRSLLPEGSLFADSMQSLHLLHNKARFASFAASLNHGISPPETVEILSPEALEGFAGRSSEWVFKPAYSRFASRTLVRPDRLAGRIRPTAGSPWIAQRYVDGDEYSTYAIAVDGRVTAFVAYKSKYRNRSGPGGTGAGIYFEPVHRPGLLSFAQCVATTLSLTGQFGFDVISTRDRTWVIECNPRATSGLHLLDDRDPGPYLDGIAGDLWTAAPGAKMLAPAMLLASQRRVRFRDFLKARDVLWAKDDPLPAMMAFLTILELYRIAWRERISPTEASTVDLEWNGEA